HAPADHHEAGAVSVFAGDGDRGGDAGGIVHAVAGDQRASALDRQPIGGGAMSTARKRSPLQVVRRYAAPAGLTLVAIGFLVLFLLVPLVAVFYEAWHDGIDAYFEALREPDAQSAIKLTLLAAGIAVPMNLVFGIAASWAIAKFDFVGKSVLTTLIDLP